MRTTGIRVVAAVPGLLMLVSGIGWITEPASAAERQGSPLLDGTEEVLRSATLPRSFLGLGLWC